MQEERILRAMQESPTCSFCKILPTTTKEFVVEICSFCKLCRSKPKSKVKEMMMTRKSVQESIVSYCKTLSEEEEEEFRAFVDEEVRTAMEEAQISAALKKEKEAEILRKKVEDAQICGAKEEAEMCSSVEEEVGSDSCLVCKICAAKEVGSWSHVGCKICACKAAALNRIKAAGGDSIKEAEDSALRAAADICVIKAVPRIFPSQEGRAKSTEVEIEEGKAKLTGVVKKTLRVPESYIKSLLTDLKITPFHPLPEDFFQAHPNLRETMLAASVTALKDYEKYENILYQFFNKGFAVNEVHIDYDRPPSYN